MMIQGREMQSKRDRNEMLEDFIAAYDYLKNHKDCNGKVGVVGFCFGGWIANMMAVRIPGFVGSRTVLWRSAGSRRCSQNKSTAAVALCRARYPC